jgi:glutathione S-transferase
MIKLYGGGSHFGLPDPSPFVVKAEVLLKMAGLPYAKVEGNFGKAPKGKIPYIDDNGTILGDSTFIRWHLEEKHGAVFDAGLSAVERATGWAFEKLVEDHLYFANVDSRWTDDEDFNNGPAVFFNAAPAPIRPFVKWMIRRQVRNNLRAQGMGRHTRAEIVRLATADLAAVSIFLADKSWLFGQEPCGADAAVWACISSALCPHFNNAIRTAGEQHANLVAYRRRGMERWFPDLAKATA